MKWIKIKYNKFNRVNDSETVDRHPTMYAAIDGDGEQSKQASSKWKLANWKRSLVSNLSHSISDKNSNAEKNVS